MSEACEEMEAGHAAFGALLMDLYGLPIAHWAEGAAWNDLQTLQVSHALDVLIAAPISDSAEASPGALPASETGARRRFALSDAKIAARGWEGSWQWELLTAIDNATMEATGGMVTPADPRMLVMRTRYRSDFMTVLAAYLAEALCGRALLRWFEISPEAARPIGRRAPEAAMEQAAALRQVPGLERASPDFLAGLLLMIERLGPKAFCAWCEDLC
jgi:hypothetical protein